MEKQRPDRPNYSSMERVSEKCTSEVSETNQARVLLKTTGLEKGVRSVRALLDYIALTFLHRGELMLFGGVSVAHDHVDLAVAQHRCERYEVNAGHCHSCRPRVPQVVQPEWSNLAAFDCGRMRGIHLDDRSLGTATRKQIITIHILESVQ